MANLMRIKYQNRKMKQPEIANQLSYSSSTLQRYRNDKNIPSPYRNNPNNNNKRTKKALNTKSNNNSHSDSLAKRPQLTSNDLITTQIN